MRHSLKFVVLALALIAPVVWSTQAMAGSVVLTLVQTSLGNVDDAMGRWQHEGGIVKKGTTTVGYYQIARRVTTGGTTAYNTAQTTVALYLGAYYNNITLQGAHYFTNGYFYGSTSGTATRYAFLRGGDATMVPTSTSGTRYLYLYWNGASQLTVP